MTTNLPPSVVGIIDLALEEDLGRGDVTTRLVVPEGAAGAARAVARQELVVSGLDVFQAVMSRIDPGVVVKSVVADGDRVADGEVIIEASGPLASLLMGERTALNFLQRLSGVATLTREFVDAVPEGSQTRVLDTRKTTPGLRFLEKRAVLHGGGANHRPDLGGGVLIKENHVAAAGSLSVAVSRCRLDASHSLSVQVEVRDAEELRQAITAGADAVLLDNMSPEQVRECVELAAGRVMTEASGGVDLGRVAEFAATGVDAVSAGALTHSAPAADISFLVDGVAANV
ncbi:MAG: carboxylating nicotinate-nucleotide diphosphorylase [Deltaproteobacteria bacterium]|nr:carboxylating nicotinate-nucleotide diphosphorylase [Deltaproteobacteria bacterium]